ncbi:hypothetical protein L915_11519 [Phytophthora nicotianae]|uniref:Uncharacterized protein n=1 Tax=Phytophthora nicotianae TaxID=4792 RepID=W2GJP0_PHYNI|nr:hypothetical protein L915_11519 [Phytophthora nicotianae]
MQPEANSNALQAPNDPVSPIDQDRSQKAHLRKYRRAITKIILMCVVQPTMTQMRSRTSDHQRDHHY